MDVQDLTLKKVWFIIHISYSHFDNFYIIPRGRNGMIEELVKAIEVK